jgi:hypothetical protein
MVATIASKYSPGIALCGDPAEHWRRVVFDRSKKMARQGRSAGLKSSMGRVAWGDHGITQCDRTISFFIEDDLKVVCYGSRV